MDSMRLCKSSPIYVYWYTKLPIYGEGHPVSWYLSNREDQILLTYYFEHLKNWIRLEQYLQIKRRGLYLIILIYSIKCMDISVFNRHL